MPCQQLPQKCRCLFKKYQRRFDYSFIDYEKNYQWIRRRYFGFKQALLYYRRLLFMIFVNLMQRRI